MLALSVAALAGIGLWGTWRAYRRGQRLGWLLPVALVATGALQARILADYPDWARWLTPIALGGAVLGAAVLLALRLRARVPRGGSRPTVAARLAAGLGTLAVLIAPAVRSGLPAATGRGGGGLPAAGPAVPRGGIADAGPDGAGPGPAGPGSRLNQAGLIAYLQAQRGDERYLLATASSMAASPIILATDQPVMALGGFSGSDPILTVDQLAARVRAGEVRFFQLGGGFGGRGTNGLAAWVQSTCTPVPPADLGADVVQPAAEPRGPNQARAQDQVYDCGGLRGTSV